MHSFLQKKGSQLDSALIYNSIFLKQTEILGSSYNDTSRKRPRNEIEPVSSDVFRLSKMKFDPTSSKLYVYIVFYINNIIYIDYYRQG